MNGQPPRQDRDFLIHYARVLITQARVFKNRGDSFYLTLLGWARKARNDAQHVPRQLELLA